MYEDQIRRLRTDKRSSTPGESTGDGQSLIDVFDVLRRSQPINDDNPRTRGAVLLDLRCCNELSLSLFEAFERSSCWCHADEQPLPAHNVDPCPPHDMSMLCLTESDRRGERRHHQAVHGRNVDLTLVSPTRDQSAN